MAGKRKGNIMTDEKRGEHALKAFVRASRLNQVEAAQDYTVTDAIVALMFYARSKGWDVDSLMRSAATHFEAETWQCPTCDYVGDADLHVECEACLEGCVPGLGHEAECPKSGEVRRG